MENFDKMRQLFETPKLNNVIELRGNLKQKISQSVGFEPTLPEGI